jgi:hypothetical protein
MHFSEAMDEPPEDDRKSIRDPLVEIDPNPARRTDIHQDKPPGIVCNRLSKSNKWPKSQRIALADVIVSSDHCEPQAMGTT